MTIAPIPAKPSRRPGYFSLPAFNLRKAPNTATVYEFLARPMP